MNENARTPLRPISCDDVARLNKHLRALLIADPKNHHEYGALQLSALLSIMDTLGLGFEDDAAVGNALSNVALSNFLPSGKYLKIQVAEG